MAAAEDGLKNAVVITEIVVVGAEGEELLTETTRYTNLQNAVVEKDFIALEKGLSKLGPDLQREIRGLF